MFVRQNIRAYNKNSEVYNVNTRNKHELNIPCYRLHKVHGSLSGHSIRFYNNIPQIILDISKFKEHVKTVLMNNGYYTIDDYLKDKKAWI